MLFHFIPFLLFLQLIIPTINGQNDADTDAAQQKSLKCRRPSEVYNACGKRCEAKCGDPPEGRPCIKICDPPACACAKNYARNNETGRCVPKSKCPSPDDGIPTNPCAVTDCITGSNCVVVNGKAKCVSNNPDVCANKTCPIGQVCYPEVVQCFRAPCPPLPTCRHAVCLTVKCAVGYKCVEPTQCPAPPCPSGCVPDNADDAKTVNND